MKKIVYKICNNLGINKPSYSGKTRTFYFSNSNLTLDYKNSKKPIVVEFVVIKDILNIIDCNVNIKPENDEIKEYSKKLNENKIVHRLYKEKIKKNANENSGNFNHGLYDYDTLEKLSK